MKAKINILIVEDSADDALLMKRELERADYAVTSIRVETEAELRRALAQGPWDAVLCDFSMPKFDGGTALKIVTNIDPDLPFIFVSGKMGEEVAVEAMKSGAHDYVLKGNLKRLSPAVEREMRAARLRRERRVMEADRERLIVGLREAMMEVKRLSGLLPICANCKKIRNERNEWQQIEVFIREHSEAQFTHSLCPGCIKRLYEFPGGDDKTQD